MTSLGPAPGTEARFLQVQTTTDARAEAMEVASTYWWENSLERAEEWLVIFKLPADRYQQLADFLSERHSYDEPEIVATPIVDGSPAYLSWIEEETHQE
jgi:periplasmic divalent cation tolerance protein